MKFLVGILATLMAGHAVAADMAVKAPQAPASALFSGYPYSGSGVYWGASTMATGENPTINGTVATSLQAFGGSLGGVVGYQYGRGSVAYAIEAGAYYQDVGGASVCTQDAACRVNSSFEAVQKVKAITPMANLISLLPAFSNVAQPALPVLPAGVSVSTMHAYLMVSLHEADISASVGAARAREWEVRPGFGVGTIAQLSNNSAIDVFAEYLPPGQSINIGPAMAAKTGAKYVVGTSLLW